MKIVTVKEMQEIEKSADAAGVSYLQMMQNAGSGIAEWLNCHLSLAPGVIGLVGSGNNGGDTLIALSELAKKGVRTLAFLVKQRKNDALIRNLIDLGGDAINLYENLNLSYLYAALQPGVVVMDGILGTGLKLPVRGVLHDVMANIHKAIKDCPGSLLIAVDCPSGVDCETGEVSDVTIPAIHTLTLAAVKQGLLKHPARSYVGLLHCIDIGVQDTINRASNELPEMIDETTLRAILPTRADSGHKGTFGTCLIIAGTRPYTGAVFLAGKAAYLAGCGLVHIATTGEVQASLSGMLPEAIWTILPDSEGGYDPQGVFKIQNALEKADSLVFGPGWGLHVSSAKFLEKLLQVISRKLPTLIDADGLKLLPRIENWWEKLPEKCILTPHPGEMSILTGLKISEIQSDRWSIAKQYAKLWGKHLMLKGAISVFATPQGKLLINPLSDAALATAGSGDVLSGIIGGLLAQSISADHAAVIGTWIHTHAGQSAHLKAGTSISVTAEDIVTNIGNAFAMIEGAG